jgi:hypothetical protein
LNIFDHLSQPNIFFKTAPLAPKPEEDCNYISKTIDESFGQHAQIDSRKETLHDDQINIHKKINDDEEQKT